MTSIIEASQQAELALAAYADFSGPTAGYQKALQDVGMSEAQAADFLKHWTVVDRAVEP